MLRVARDRRQGRWCRMALMAEWFGHGALHENPGLVLHGLEDMRILNGIRLSAETKLIRAAGRQGADAGTASSRWSSNCATACGEGKDILHSRARAILAEDYARPPAYRLPEALSCNHYPRSAAEIYEKILFHGSRLHGLRSVRMLHRGRHGGGCDRRARRRPSGSPPRCATPGCATRSRSTRPSRWRASGATSSAAASRCPSTPPPTGSSGPRFPAEGVKVVLEVREATGQENARRLHVPGRRRRR
ncbi:MAG: hypothetical protein MZV70_51470 [Desulfobacterales bacterium]|nr:hypothetical protein [Desulfobacterales bacterium]